MTRWTATVLLLSSLAGCTTGERTVLFTGRCAIDGANDAEPSTYRMVENKAENTITLFVDAPETKRVWSAEVGQTKPTAVYSKYLPGAGNLLVVEADEGASMLRLVLIAVSNNGGSRTVFDEKSRFGFDMLNLDSDPGTEIVGISGDLAGPKTVRVFGWDGTAFAERSRVQSSDLPQYQIVTHSTP